MSIALVMPSNRLISDALLSSILNLSQHQGPSQWVGCLHQMTKMLELQLQHQPLQWVFSVGFPSDWLVWSPCSLGDFQESSPAPQFESISSLAFCLLYGPALKPVCDHWEDHSLNCLHLCHQSLCFLTHCLDLSQLSCQEAIMSRDQTMKAWILNHWTTREVLHFLFLNCCPETQVSEIPKSYMSIPVPAWVNCYNSLLQKTDSLIAWGIEKGVHFQTLACLSGGSLEWVDGVACPRVCSQGSSWDRMASEVKAQDIGHKDSWHSPITRCEPGPDLSPLHIPTCIILHQLSLTVCAVNETPCPGILWTKHPVWQMQTLGTEIKQLTHRCPVRCVPRPSAHKAVLYLHRTFPP